MRYIELFAGIGGFRAGLEPLGHECVGWVEMDKFARKSYEAIFPSARKEWTANDITTVTDDDLRRLSKRVGKIDLICFGSPCQDVSVAGRRAGFTKDGERTRSGLFFEAMRFARVLRPTYLLMENVVGLLSSNGGEDFAFVITEFHQVGMEFVEWDVLNATQFGIPQNRERVFIVGSRSGRGRKVFPLGFDGTEDKTEIEVVGMMDIKGQENIRRVYAPTGVAPTLTTMGGENRQPKIQLSSQVSRTIRSGGKGSLDGKRTWDLVQVGVVRQKQEDGIFQYSEREHALTIDANYYKGLDAHQARTGVMELRAVIDPIRQKKTQNGRLVKEHDEPMFTLTTQDKHGVMLHQLMETRIRRLTPKECWRLMGRQDWEFERAKNVGVSESQLYKQAGNSLIPQIVTAIARKFEA